MYFRKFCFLHLFLILFCLVSSVANASIPTWRILWIILPRINAAHTDGVTYNFTLNKDDITKIREMSERVERFIEEATGNAVDVEMTVLESTGTVTSLTENTYLYVGEDDFPSDVKRELERAHYEDKPYEVKVATFRLHGENNPKISDWFGLGGGRYARVHFFKDTKASDFNETPTSPHPEEVWVHELIHCFESIFGDLGTMAGLHDDAKYGYTGENGWSKWYHDILAGQVKDPSTGEFVGIKSDMWRHLLPTHITYWEGHTYKVLDTVRTWSEAKSYCESMGGHLVTITSEQEQNVVATLLKQAATWNYFGYWMGAQKDSQKAPKWHWVTGEAFKYTKFSDGQPDGSGDYLQMYNYPDQGNWDDTTSYANVEIQGGYYPHGMICEWEYTETPPVTILTANHLPGGIVNTNYSFQLKAEKGTAVMTATTSSTPTWSLVSGILPNNLTLNQNGLLTGIPISSGSFDFTVKAEIDAGNGATNTAYILKTFTLEITSDCVAPVITTVDLKDANTVDEYHRTLEVKGSTATWSIIDKYLPAELVLSPNGEITGKPLAEGTYEFTVRASNSAGYDDKTFCLTVIDASFPVAEMEEDEQENENSNSTDEQGNNENNKNNENHGQENDEEQNNIDKNENHETDNVNGNNESNNGQSVHTQPPQQQTETEVNNPQEQNNTQSDSSSGGGGCNSFQLIGILLLTLLLKKNIKNS